jgi:hypothetical protein
LGWLEACFLVSTWKLLFSSVRRAAFMLMPTTLGIEGNGFAIVRKSVEPSVTEAPEGGLIAKTVPARLPEYFLSITNLNPD